MLSIFVFYVLIALSQARIIDQKCDGVVIHNINHEKEVLKEEISSPYQLAIDYDTNTLFFSFNTNNYSEIFASGYINLKTHEYGKIFGISGGFSNAVDGKNHIVYLGGNDGIYKFDYDYNKAIYATANNTSIWQLFFKNKLYYTVYPTEAAYFYEDSETKKVPELNGTRAMLVAVDNNDNIFFSNSSGLFCYKKSESKVMFKGKYNLNGFSADINGNLYFSTTNGIYSIDESGERIGKIAGVLGYIYGLAIEGDNNIIYSTEDSIVRLKATGGAVCPNTVYEKNQEGEDN